MLRNLAVTGVVSVIMGITTVAYRSVAPPEAQPAMDAQTPSTQVATSGVQGNQAASQSQMASQTPVQGTLPSGQEGQQTGLPTASTQTGGTMSGAQQSSSMKMCPCMKMMMGGMGGNMNQSGAATQSFSNPRTKDQAKQRAEAHLKSQGNPNLKVGDVNETAAAYEVQVVTKENSLVNWIIIDKKSGQLKTRY